MENNNVFFILSLPVIWKEQVVLVVGAASSRDHLIPQLEAAPTGSFFMVTWTFRISALSFIDTCVGFRSWYRIDNNGQFSAGWSAGGGETQQKVLGSQPNLRLKGSNQPGCDTHRAAHHR